MTFTFFSERNTTENLKVAGRNNISSDKTVSRDCLGLSFDTQSPRWVASSETTTAGEHCGTLKPQGGALNFSSRNQTGASSQVLPFGYEQTQEIFGENREGRWVGGA